MVKEKYRKGIGSSKITFDLEGDDIDNYFKRLEPLILKHLSNQKKIKLTIYANMYLPLPFDARNYITAYFTHKPITILSLNQLPSKMDETKDYFKVWVEMFQTRGSGFVFDKIIKTDLNIYDIKQMSASSYFKLPFSSPNIINIQNKDQRCFLWSVLAYFHTPEKNPQRVSKYEPFENEINMKGIKYPFKKDDINKFEKQNPDIGINVFGLDLDLTKTMKIITVIKKI